MKKLLEKIGEEVVMFQQQGKWSIEQQSKQATIQSRKSALRIEKLLREWRAATLATRKKLQ